MTITNKIKTVEINLPKLYQEFQEENIHCLGLWDWEQERDAFGCYCYLEARKELIEEEIEFLNNLRNDFPNRDELIHYRIKQLQELKSKEKK